MVHRPGADGVRGVAGRRRRAAADRRLGAGGARSHRRPRCRRRGRPGRRRRVRRRDPGAGDRGPAAGASASRPAAAFRRSRSTGCCCATSASSVSGWASSSIARRARRPRSARGSASWSRRGCGRRRPCATRCRRGGRRCRAWPTAGPGQGRCSSREDRPRALAFDVFGTVVDWRSSIIGELRCSAKRHGLATRIGRPSPTTGGPATRRRWTGCARGELPWLKIDALHRLILDDLLDRAGIESDPRRGRRRPQPRLAPARSVAGLGGGSDAAQASGSSITTLSNGNVSLLTNMAKRAGLPWDCVISAELFHHYKPDREAYLGCADLLDVAPGELDAGRRTPSDLRAARDAGLMTAYVARPLERGPGEATDGRGRRVRLHGNGFLDLVAQLGA